MYTCLSLQLSFSDVFGEPEYVASTEQCWNSSKSTYECSQRLCYKILSSLCAVPSALCHGCLYACLAFEVVWCYTPSFQGMVVTVHHLGRVFSLYVSCLLRPFCDACGSCIAKALTARQPKAQVNACDCNKESASKSKTANYI